MGNRVKEFSHANPASSPGFEVTVARLDGCLTRVEKLAGQQREGLLKVRSATEQKRELQRTMRRTHLSHLAHIAEIAAADDPDIAQKFAFAPPGRTYLAFRTAARGMEAEALSRKELLLKHGLAESVLDGLTQSLNQFDAALEHGAEGRRTHIGASADLDAVADEIVKLVRAMDGFNRLRYARDPELLAAWTSASTVAATPRSAAEKPAAEKPAPETQPPADGAVRPAA